MASLTIKLLHDTGFSKNDGITNNAAVTGSGVDANAVVTVYSIFDGVYYSLGTTTANASGDWTFTPYGLAAGAVTLVAASDASTSATLGFTYIPPGTTTIRLQLDTGPTGDGITADDVLTGLTSPGATLLVYQDSAEVTTLTANSLGSWTYQPVGLSQGLHSVTVEDVAGNTGALSFTYDTIAPTVTVAAQQSGALSGTGEAGGTVVIAIDGKIVDNARVYASGGQGVWNDTPTGLSDGVHAVVITETDGAGNTGTATTTFTLAPAPTIQLQLDSGLAGDLITNDDVLAGTTRPDNSLTVTDDGHLVATVAANAAGSWSYAPSTLTQGGHSFVVLDPQGNTAGLSFTYDSVAPTITLKQNPSLPRTLGGVVEPGDPVTLVVDGSLTLTPSLTMVANTDFWTYAIPGLSAGSHTAVATATDLAGNTGTATLAFSVPCYLAGTRLRTPTGWAAVEALSAGDTVLTADGRHEQVRWIGHHTHARQEALANPKLTPVVIRQHAFAAFAPIRDLLLSPDHAVLVGGVLAQAGALVNGTSILRGMPITPEVVYYHVELSRHALLLAEDLPAESFVDNVDRAAFDNWNDGRRALDAAPMEELPQPRAKSWRQVPRAARQALVARGTALYGAAGQVA